MKNYSFLTILFLTIIFVISCTDVPLSYNTIVSNSSIIGYWQNEKGKAMSISINNNGKAIYNEYTYDGTSGNFIKGKDCYLYFTTLSIKNVPTYFISYDNSGEDKDFLNFKMSFDKNGNLILKLLNENLFKDKNGKLNKGIFKTTKNFQDYVKSNYISKEFFSSVLFEYNKKSDSEAFSAPEITQPNSEPANITHANTHVNMTSDEKAIKMVKVRMMTILHRVGALTVWSFKEAYNFRITERDGNGTVKKMLFDYSLGQKTFNKWTDRGSGSVEIYFNNGYPYLMYGDPYREWEYDQFPVDHYEDGDEADTNPSVDFTAAEKKLIEKAFNDYKLNSVYSNVSFQAVMRKHEGYKNNYDFKNCLAVMYVDVTISKMVEVPVSQVYDMGTQTVWRDAGVENQPYFYKNISNRTIILRAIQRSIDGRDFSYSDASIQLKPGEVTYKVDINKSFDVDYSFSIQFLGDPGVIKQIGKKK